MLPNTMKQGPDTCTKGMASQTSAKSSAPLAKAEVSSSTPPLSKSAKQRRKKAARKAADANDLKSASLHNAIDASTASPNAINAMPMSTRIPQTPPAAQEGLSRAQITSAKSPAATLSSSPKTPGSQTISYAMAAVTSPPAVFRSRASSRWSDDWDDMPKLQQPLEDLYVMIRQQRQELFQGALITIDVQDRNGAVKGIYKRVAMAISPVLNRYFEQNPYSMAYTSREFADAEAIRYLLGTWMEDIRDQFEVEAVPMQETFIANVKLLRASHILGMERYTQHIMNTYLEYLMTEIPSYDEIDYIDLNTTSDKDPLWSRMVNHLCHARYQQYIPDPEEFALFLSSRPRLTNAMERSDNYFRDKAQKNRELDRARYEARQHQNRIRYEAQQNRMRVLNEVPKQQAQSDKDNSQHPKQMAQEKDGAKGGLPSKSPKGQAATSSRTGYY